MDRVELTAEGLSLGKLGPRWTSIAAAVGLAGMAASVLVALRTAELRQVFFHSYLVNFMFFLSLALGGLFFVLVTHLTRAGWSVALRRIAEVTAWGVLPLTVLGVVLLFGLHDLYEWTHLDAVAADPLLVHKQPWLNTTFFLVRLALYFGVWNVISAVFLRGSTRQDRTADPEITRKLEVVAAPAMIFYAMTLTFASFDLIMSLYPHWYSTIFGVYYFSGAVVGFFALVPVVVGLLRSNGLLVRAVTTEHFHDMGKLMFAFVVFWAYIAFSQYFLIWYGNIPEETVFYETRQTGPWLYLSLLLLFGHFILPFLFLLSRHPKRRPVVLIGAAVWLLLMHWCDLFYLIVPGTRTGGTVLSVLDLTCFLGIGGLFFAGVFWRMGRAKLIPMRDPRLGESLGFENV